MSHEIVCPHCNKAFTVDEAGYAAIVSQVRNSEYQRDLERERRNLEDSLEARISLALAKTEKEYGEKLSQKEEELSSLRTSSLIEKEKLEGSLKALRDSFDSERRNLSLQSDTRIKEYEARLEEKSKDWERNLERLRDEKDREISALNEKIRGAEGEKALALMEKDNELKDTLRNKELEIVKLKGEVEKANADSLSLEMATRDKYEARLKAMEEQVAFYKDFKARQSTKMIGESLERYCWDLFEGVRLTGYRNAYFEKDNEVVEGSKGDFVFRDFTEDGMEYISIMFEMKNEADSTAEKHRNSDFFEKLHKDRNRKKCEYAVLVSMLESDSERYNAGIVEVPQYEKMYVVRPQCFLPIIQILRDVARRTIEDRKALIAERNKNIDITNFEEELISFKTRFGQNILNSQKKFQEAIDAIDKSIKDLVKVKEALNLSIKHLGAADNKLEDLTIRKLTRNNPTMKGLFEEARALKEKTEAEEVEGELD